MSELLEALGQGEARSRLEQRVAVLYERHSSSATRYALVLTGDDEIAQDLVQEAFVRVMSQLRRSREEPTSFGAYLRRAILNTWRSRLRRRQLERRHPVERDVPPISHDLDTRELMWQALMRLPLRQRTAVFLRYYEDLPVWQIAQELGCSEGAARSLLLHAMEKLRKDKEVNDVV